MTEPIFKAPLPPENSGFTPPSSQKDGEQKVNATSLQDIKQKISAYLWYVLGGAFLVGLILGISMAGGESTPVAPECLLRRTRNPDIQERFPLCGLTSQTEPCILYIMNSTRYEKYAEDYFEEAQRLTGRSIPNISVENAVYAKVPIYPGWFAEIKIPSLR